jgi:hypothetical protein
MNKKLLLIGGLLGAALAFGTLSSFKTSTQVQPEPIYITGGTTWSLYKVIDAGNTVYICQGENGQISITK